LAWLERNQLRVLAVSGLLLVAGFLARDLTQDTPPALVLQPPDADEIVVVHVAGAVLRPGVYELAPGARIQDAIVAAGGAEPDAGTGALNLARRVRDGERIEIAGAGPAEAAAATTLLPGEKLDLNAASAEQLDRLPGIGEAYTRRIIDSRAVDGPYAAVDDLLARRVIPNATFEQIRDLVTVRAP
jgi:competence protein ComEA